MSGQEKRDEKVQKRSVALKMFIVNLIDATKRSSKKKRKNGTQIACKYQVEKTNHLAPTFSPLQTSE
jgi:hypothetical protein